MGCVLMPHRASLTRLYFATAVGIALGTRHINDALNDAGYAIRTIRLTGGHAASPLLVQLYADASDVSVSLPEQPDGVLLGTACVAAAGCGLYPSVTAAAAAMTRIGRTVQPAPAARDFLRPALSRVPIDARPSPGVIAAS